MLSPVEQHRVAPSVYAFSNLQDVVKLISLIILSLVTVESNSLPLCASSLCKYHQISVCAHGVLGISGPGNTPP